jgi:hypothetical protein
VKEKFFSEETNLKAIANFLKKGSVVNCQDKVKCNQLEISKKIIGFIHTNPDKWDDKCKFNIKHIGDQFISICRNFDPKDLGELDDLYCLSYRLLCEFDLFIGSGMQLGFDLLPLKRRI